jgi:hypothetical protein
MISGLKQLKKWFKADSSKTGRKGKKPPLRIICLVQSFKNYWIIFSILKFYK